jgi:outer membrane lipoprotein-sorting protein
MLRVTLQTVFLGTMVIGWLLTAAAPAQIVGESAELEHVLAQMDAAARDFKTAEANVVWDQYQKVISETETEKGKIYFRREGGEIQMAADFAEPDKKYVIYSGGKVQVYQPKIDQVTEYNAGKNRGDVESFLVLGFGGSGRDLFKSYAVRFLATEIVGGIKADELELIPKSDRFRSNIARIWLWIDPVRGISVQQQFFEPSGDYRLAKYSEIQMKQKLPEDVFKLKTTKKTKFVSPQG